MPAERQIIPRTFLVGLGTMTSRILGLVREMVTASLLGAGAGFDLFLIAFMIPNLFRRIFGEGAMRDAFLPVFGKELADPNGDPRRLFNIVMTALAVLLGGIALLGCIGCWVAYQHPAISERGALFCLLLAIMLPYLPLICLTALQSSALNQKGRFFIPAMVPILLNVCWIVGLLLYGKKYGTKALAFSVLAAGVLQFVAQIPLLWRHRLYLFPVWDLAHKGLRRIVVLMLPVALASGVFQINVMVDRLIALFFVPKDGAVSVLYFGNRLMQLPLAVLGLAITTAAFPLFVHHAVRGRREELVSTVNMALRLILFLVLPCMALLIALRTPIVQVLFERGAFTSEATRRTALVLLYYVIGLWGFCALSLLTRVFYALEDTKTPMRIAMKMVVMNLVLNVLLVWPMKEAGLALASTATAIGNVAILIGELRPRLGSLGLKAIFKTALKCGVASVLGGAAGYKAHALLMSNASVVAGARNLLRNMGLPAQWAASGGDAILLIAGLAAGGVVFLAVALVLRTHELREAAQILRQKKPSC